MPRLASPERKLTCFQPQRNAKFRHTETGPGSRSTINMIQGWTKTLFLYNQSRDVADMYSGLVVDEMKRWRAVIRKERDVYPSELHAHLDYFASEGFDEVYFQFVLCETSKLVAWLLTSDKRYRRDYVPPDNADEEEDEEGEDPEDCEPFEPLAAAVGGA